ncbi:MAG: hypothetical protein CMI90_06430 [Pelagibacteraceae bacterium]|nr:hypothetical protein [Pelagibacteraceae bacterium]|tara:strand:+ start:3351 stop:4619 length:1269 start_codon:yes stop_codon:yes gene_type:complete
MKFRKNLFKKINIIIENGSTTLCPKNTKEVSIVLKICHINNIEVIPIGGNTNRVLGTYQKDKKKSVFLSLRNLNKIIKLDTENLVMEVEAGATLAKVQKKALNKNLLFPVHVASHKECNIGGNISTNVGGLQVLRYGNIENNINGLEYVLPDGTIINQLSFLKKDNFGPKIWRVLCGSEGTYGVITKASLKLIPKKLNNHTFLIEIQSLNKIFKLFKQLREKFFDELTSFEVIFPKPINLITNVNEKNFNIIIEFQTNNNHSYKINFKNFKILKFEKNSINSKIWPIRKLIITQQDSLLFKYKYDISLPINNWSLFLKKMELFHKNNKDYDPYYFGHLGDGNLHCNYKINDPNKQKIKNLEEQIYKIVLNLKGSLAAEHGLGYRKNYLVKKYKTKEIYTLLNNFKEFFDKKKLLNRDKLIKS